MTDEERRYADAAVRIDQFGLDNGADFPPSGQATFVAVTDIVNEIQSTGGEQMAAVGETGQQTEIKGIKREALRYLISAVARTARQSLIFLHPGIDELFRMPRNRNDADLLSAARAFVLAANPYKSDFIDNGLPNTWIEDLTAAADEFEATLGTTASAQAERAQATAEMHDWVVRFARLRRMLDGNAKNVYANNPGKMAAWLQASHIERPPKKKTPPAPPVPPAPPEPPDE